MAEQVLGSSKDDDGISKKHIHAYESAWMGRWARMGVEPAVQGHGCLSLKEDPGCSKELSLAIGSKMVIGDSVSTERCRDGSECRRVDNVEENIEERREEKPGNERREVSTFPMFNVSQGRAGVAASRKEEFRPFPKAETSSKKRSLILVGDIPGEPWTKSCEFPEKNSLAISSSSCDVIGSSSKAVGNKRLRMHSLMYMQKENALSTPSLGCKEKFSFPVQEKSDHNPIDLTRSVRTYKEIDSGQGTSRVPYDRFPQTARHFLFTKKTNVNFSEDVQLLRKSTVSMKLKGKMFNGFSNLFPDLLFRHQEQLRPLHLGSSKDSEGLEKFDEVKNSGACIKNESSAETDTLEMDTFQRNHLSGSTSSSSKKVKERENQSGLPKTKIPDMNQEPPIVSDRENSMDGHGGETSPSKTQSMNVEHFISDSVIPTECYRREPEPEPEPSSLWVKRLKPSALDSTGCGTNSMKMKESSLGEKANDFFLEIMKCRITNPEISSTSKSKNPNPPSEEITLQHPWIQRWCGNKATPCHQPSKPEVSCEAAENPKGTAFEETPKKQFPSIGAMALMGKALSGFSPSGLRKTGSTIVWNIRDLR